MHQGNSTDRHLRNTERISTPMPGWCHQCCAHISSHALTPPPSSVMGAAEGNSVIFSVSSTDTERHETNTILYISTKLQDYNTNINFQSVMEKGEGFLHFCLALQAPVLGSSLWALVAALGSCSWRLRSHFHHEYLLWLGSVISFHSTQGCPLLCASCIWSKASS